MDKKHARWEGYTSGCTKEASGIHAGGLRWTPGASNAVPLEDWGSQSMDEEIRMYNRINVSVQRRMATTNIRL